LQVVAFRKRRTERPGREPRPLRRLSFCALLPSAYQVLDPAEWQPPQVFVVGFQLLTVTSTVPFWWVAVFTVWAVKL
jgi:hypothetical protein